MQTNLQDTGRDGGFSLVQIEEGGSSSGIPSGVHPEEAMGLGTSVAEPLYPGVERWRDHTAHFVLGNVLGAPQAHCQLHHHQGVSHHSPHPHPN